MKKLTALFSIIVLIVITILTQAHTSTTVQPVVNKYHNLFFSGGITGQSTNGCSCHGPTETPAVVVSITGLPANPIENVTYTLSINISGTNPYAGYNVAASTGTLGLVAGNTESQISGGELTHTAPKLLISGTTSFDFEWTAGAALNGPVTFTYAGNNVNGSGSGGDFWNKGSITAPIQTLPVSLTSFAGNSLTSNTNKLLWQVAQEINFKHYEVERSCDGINFTTITIIPANRNSSLAKEYSYLDNSFTCTEKTYYRLKMVDLNNSFQYSSIIPIISAKKDAQAFVYPNPILSKSETVNVYTGKQAVQQVQVINSLGKVLLTKVAITNANATITLPKLITSGTYYVTIKYVNGISKSLPLVVQ